jgi:hypothetical protein
VGVFVLDALRTEDHGRLEQFVKQGLFLVHQGHDEIADLGQTLAGKLCVQIICRSV